MPVHKDTNAQSHETAEAGRTAQAGMATAAQTTERTLNQFAEVFGLSRERVQEAAQQSSRNLEAITECGTVLANGSRRSRVSG